MFLALILFIITLAEPSLAQYTGSMFTTATAAFVSLRLGYTAKAGVENYNKIRNTYSSIAPVEETTDESNG